MEENNLEILAAIKSKSILKQEIYKITLQVMQTFKMQMATIADQVTKELKKEVLTSVNVEYKSHSEFEADLKFGGDTLVYMMHTNIFQFPLEHEVYKTQYIKEDPTRAYCGVINVYDFLSDSIKYNRFNDLGYLVTRIFINKDRHFMVQGRKQFSYMYNDLSQFEINTEVINQILKQSIINTIDFELLVPPFDKVKEIRLGEKIAGQGTSALATGKRLGFTRLDQNETPKDSFVI
ncbi:MAG: hypothetical protein SGJ04_08920 [Bacteroidota bacterium]|nr:hypothetical protein [Bacteroidota bacterium]